MSPELITLFFDSALETLWMVGAAGLASTLLGLPLGVLLALSDGHGLLRQPWLNRLLGLLVNALRSTPFIILMVAVIPLTRWLVGTSIGTSAAVVPLTIAATAFVARLIESNVRELDRGLSETLQAMGATPWQIVRKALIPEALPGIIASVTMTLISLIGYSAMAGAVGGGGLGDLGMRYGYQRFLPEVMALVVLALIVLVALVQSVGARLAQRVNHR
ncbi:MAG: methionine ABC transporter permease [Pseudomonadota bacterium]